MGSQIGIIIQARLGSTRLPGKMLAPFYGNKSILEILLRRIKRSIRNVKIIVATTNSAKDDKISTLAKQLEVECYRGSEDDVLGRFINTGREYKLDKIIRVCADNPFLDMLALKKLVDSFSEATCDYLSFSTSKGVPSIKTHYGFWAEAISLDALEKVNNLTSSAFHHEHVTSFIYSNPNLFNVEFIKIPTKIENKSRIRLTLDTLDDFNMQKEIYSKVVNRNLDFDIDDILEVLELNPSYYIEMEEQILKNSK